MLKSRISTFAGLLLLLTGAHASTCLANDREQSQQFFNMYCVSCHGPKKPKARLRHSTSLMCSNGMTQVCFMKSRWRSKVARCHRKMLRDIQDPPSPGHYKSY